MRRTSPSCWALRNGGFPRIPIRCAWIATLSAFTRATQSTNTMSARLNRTLKPLAWRSLRNYALSPRSFITRSTCCLMSRCSKWCSSAMPNNYGPEVWTVEYRVQQEQVATRGEYWQTRILRPRFTQLYPPEKHAPHMIVEARYPADLKAPTIMALIQGNDPTIAQLGGSDARFAKVIEAVDKGQAQKAAPADAADFLRAVLPLIAGEQSFILAKMEEQHGFNWIVPPDEPVERAKKGEEDKNRPPDAPSLRRRPNPPDR